MARTSRASLPRSSEAPRAKTLARELGVSPALLRAVERYEEASSAFARVCEERHGCGDLDERYGDLAHYAAEVVRALLEDRTRALLGPEIAGAVAPYERGERRAGQAPEDDVAVAERTCRELRARSSRSSRAPS